MRWTLRAQIAVATSIIVLLVVATAGALIALSIDSRDRADVNDQLTARAERVFADVDKLRGGGDSPGQPGNDSYGELLDGSDSLVRLFDGDRVIAERGAIPDDPPAAPTAGGLSTVNIDGTDWRSYVVSTGDGITLQVLQSLAPVNDRQAANTRLVTLVTVLAAALSGAVGWLVARGVLRPLEELSNGAVAIAADPDPAHRLPEASSPSEVAALSATLNTMLDRLGASTETTRRFAADVGHELRGPLTASTTYLETLLNSPKLPDELRQEIAAAHNQQQRMAAVLGVLQVLARADAGAVPAPTDIEPGLLVEELVRLVGSRYPHTTFTFADDSDGAVVSGWADGLRLAIDNLLTNAAIHGKPNGTVRTQVEVTPDHVSISIADDGQGIAPEHRETVRQRFNRGAHATTTGTGLGLALVQQQADIHHGKLILTDADTGGLKAKLELPRER